MLLNYLLCICLVFGVQGVPRSDVSKSFENRIYGGADIAIKNAPYQIAIISGGKYGGCGGSIIREDVVLTAAHCLKSATADTVLQIRAGSADHSKGGQLVPVKSIVIHASYDTDTLENDIAILKLTHPLKLGKEVAIINLKEANTDVPDGRVLKVTGWGSTKDFGTYATKLQVAVLFKVNQIECKEHYHPGKYQITDSMLCAGAKGQNACSGDSGGPLVDKNVLVGVVSFGEAKCESSIPTVFTRVSSYIDWIESQVASLS